MRLHLHRGIGVRHLLVPDLDQHGANLLIAVENVKKGHAPPNAAGLDGQAILGFLATALSLLGRPRGEARHELDIGKFRQKLDERLRDNNGGDKAAVEGCGERQRQDDQRIARARTEHQRTTGAEIEAKEPAAWPIAGTRYTPLYLDAGASTLGPAPAMVEAEVRYDSTPSGGEPGGAAFDIRFDEPVELIGHMKLKAWMAAEDGDDMDLFVAVQKLDGAGDIVPFAYYAQFEDGPVALGWLRASHRELDEARSTPYQPVLAHRRALPLRPGEPVPLEIEIWPSGTRFAAGEGLRLVIQGADIYDYPKPSVHARHEDRVNRGDHVIRTGGRYDSHLLVPVIPA